ncbi:MAG: hypothetical protein RDV48_08925 [Candidatus Eremiobacteraeota bacterium]|nr:hypothetical protein [Candidatus Eremiobacteraeota bacterium]
MKLFRIPLLMAAVLLFLIIAALPSAARPDFIPAAELKRGMKGYGRSVFSGTKIESFPVTILGVIRHFIADRDLILIRIDGGPCLKSGIIAGMSGSPVYVNNRLAGAISYGWSFSKIPIAGMTPAEDMYEELFTAQPPKGRGGAAGTPLKAPLSEAVVIKGRRYSHAQLITPGLRGLEKEGIIPLSPVKSLVFARGFSRESLASLEKSLPACQIMTSVTALSEGKNAPAPPMVPGAVLGVELLSGDLEVAGAGTLTYCEGSRFMGFGHSMAQFGDVEIPVTSGAVEEILPCVDHSVRFTSSRGVVGALTLDRAMGVGGVLGKKAPSVPCEIALRDSSAHRTFRVKVIQHPYLTASLLSDVLREGIGSRTSTLRDATAEIHYAVELKNHRALEFTDVVTGSSINSAVTSQFTRYLSRIMQNDFSRVMITRLSMDVNVTAGKKSATIRAISTEKDRYMPGETMVVKIQLSPYREKPVTREVVIPIPADYPPGTIRIGACGGEGTLRMRKSLLIPVPAPSRIEQALRFVEEGEKNNELVVKAVFPRETSLVSDDEFFFLPPSRAKLFAAAPQSTMQASKDVFLSRQAEPWVINGMETLKVEIGEKKARQDSPEGKDSTASSGGFASIPFSSRQEKPARTSDDLSLTAPIPPPREPEPQPSKAPDARAGKQDQGTGKSDEGEKESALVPEPLQWSLSERSDLARGTFHNVALSSKGELRLAPLSREIPANGRLSFLALAWDRASRTLFTAGSGGKVFSLTEGASSLQQYADIDEPLITSLCAGKDGSLYVGTAPHGKLFRVTRDSRCELVRIFREPYLWALTAESDGSLLAGTGRPGAIYRVTPQGEAELLARTCEDHVLCLARSPGGRLLAGTGNRGLVVAVKPGGTTAPLFAAKGECVDAMALGHEGTIWCASGNALYAIAPGGSLKEQYLPEGPVLSLAADGKGAVYAGTGDRGGLYRAGGGYPAERIYAASSGAFTALLPSEEGGLWAATAHPAMLVHMSGEQAERGEYLSPVLDPKSLCRWGMVKKTLRDDKNGSVSLFTRSGRAPVPDSTWSEWSPPHPQEHLEKITSPEGNFLQVKALLQSAMPSSSPILEGIWLYYAKSGITPAVRIIAPSGGERWGGKKEITWSVEHFPSEWLSFDILISRDEGLTWKALRRHFREPAKKKDAIKGKGDIRFEWSTGEEKDGPVRIKISAVVPGESLGAQGVSKGFVLCNTPPSVTVEKCAMASGMITLEGRATSALAVIKGVLVRVNKDPWIAAIPRDGIFDSQDEAFSLTMEASSKNVVEIRAIDEAGNRTDVEKRL